MRRSPNCVSVGDRVKLTTQHWRGEVMRVPTGGERTWGVLMEYGQTLDLPRCDFEVVDE